MTQEKHFSLRNHFLLATPTLSESSFSHTVTYLFEHSERGAMGIVINRPINNLTIDDIFKQMHIIAANDTNTSGSVLGGGPVQTERGFVIHETDPENRRRWESSINLEGGVSITTSKDVLEAIARDEGPKHYVVALGYAGWSAGQLEEELAQNAWIYTPADKRVLFEVPFEQRLDSAAKLLGIDLRMMSTHVGHA